MPTSSLFHNFVITNPEDVARFIEAISGESDPKRKSVGCIMTDPNEIAALMKKRKFKQKN